MKRLAVVLPVSLALLAAPLATGAQPATKIPRIGILRPGLPLDPYVETAHGGYRW